jgi:hypothetical protein
MSEAALWLGVALAALGGCLVYLAGGLYIGLSLVVIAALMAVYLTRR